mgnify:CR=1 FL=1
MFTFLSASHVHTRHTGDRVVGSKRKRERVLAAQASTTYKPQGQASCVLAAGCSYGVEYTGPLSVNSPPHSHSGRPVGSGLATTVNPLKFDALSKPTLTRPVVVCESCIMPSTAQWAGGEPVATGSS